MTRASPPELSFAERDRRWAAVRSLMRDRGLGGLIVAGFRAREMYESYISDDYNEGCVVFPLEGEPVVLTWAHLRVLRARWSADVRCASWPDHTCFFMVSESAILACALRKVQLP